MREITSIEELKKIQLGILLHIDKACSEHNLKYFISDGTLLGAVRHKGYIPWDDDLDIWMPRRDYERLVEIMDKDESCYTILNHKNSPNYIYAFGKAVDNRTLLIENVEAKCPMGVYVDIFPYDGLPGDCPEDFKRHVKWCLYLENQRYRAFQSFRGVKSNHESGNIRRFLLWAVRRAIGGKNFIRAVNYFSSKYSAEETKFVGCLVAGYKEKDMMPAEIFQEAVELEFENHKFRAPVGYNQYLKIEYGDYMKLPPKEQQVTHHDFKAWWKDELIGGQ